MHVVGDDRGAVRGARSRDRPVVAAQSRDAVTPAPAAAPANPCSLRKSISAASGMPARPRRGCRRSPPPIRWRPPPGIATDLPGSAERSSPRCNWRVPGKILKLQEHGVHAQDGVLVAPRLAAGSRAPNTRTDGCASDSSPAFTPAVYARSTARLDASARRRPGAATSRNRCTRSSPVLGQKRGTEQRGQLAGGGAAHQIHLEEPVLTMQIAQRPCEIARLRAVRVGTPAASRSTVTGAVRPGSSARPSMSGKAGAQREPGGPRRPRATSTATPSDARIRDRCARIIARDFSNRHPDDHIHAAGCRRPLSGRWFREALPVAIHIAICRASMLSR